MAWITVIVKVVREGRIRVVRVEALRILSHR